MNIPKWILATQVFLAAAAVIPSTALAQEMDTAPSTTNATSQMTTSELNTTDVVNRLAQATGQTPEALAGTQAIQLGPGTFIASFVCPPDMQTLQDCQPFIGRAAPQQ